MTDIAAATSNIAVNAANASANAAKRESAVDKEELQEDYDNFLNLFLTQLQNQDPLSPLDNNQFTNSLANLSQVEQGVKTNENLEDLVTLATGQQKNYGDPVSYIGKEIEFDGKTLPLQNGEGGFSYVVDAPADSVSIIIKNTVGNTVFSEEVPAYEGVQTFAWDGKDNELRDLPDGLYSVSAIATKGDKVTELETRAKAVVTEAAFNNNDVSLKIGKDTYIPISDILKVRDTAVDSADET